MPTMPDSLYFTGYTVFVTSSHSYHNSKKQAKKLISALEMIKLSFKGINFPSTQKTFSLVIYIPSHLKTTKVIQIYSGLGRANKIRGSFECQYSDFCFYTLKNNNNDNMIYMTELTGDFDYIVK